MAVSNELQSVLAQNNGTITTAQANKVGISNERLRLLVENGDLKRARFGVYVSPEVFVDNMYVIQLRRKKIIYSHETALYMHELCDRTPLRFSVTVPSGYNTAKLRDEDFIVFTIKRELYELGVTELPTMFGNSVKVYGLERTICDCLRSRNQVDISLLTDGVKRYAKRRDKNLARLMQMADMFGVTSLVRHYMEVLL